MSLSVVYFSDFCCLLSISLKYSEMGESLQMAAWKNAWLFLFGVLFQFQSRFILDLQSECSVLGELLGWGHFLGQGWGKVCILGKPLTVHSTHQWQYPSVTASDQGQALPPCSTPHPRGLRAVMCCHIAPVSSDPVGTVSLSLRVRTVQGSFSDMKTLKGGI